MTNNDLTLIIRGTSFVFDTIDRLVHFAHGYNASQFHTSMANISAERTAYNDNEDLVHQKGHYVNAPDTDDEIFKSAAEDHAKGLDTAVYANHRDDAEAEVHAMLENEVYGDAK